MQHRFKHGDVVSLRRLAHSALGLTVALSACLAACGDDDGEVDLIPGEDGGASGNSSGSSSGAGRDGGASSSGGSSSSGSSSGGSSGSSSGDVDAGPDAAPTCATTSCDANATCSDSENGPRCACNAGYSGDGTTCSDVDECAAATDDCDAVATCANTPGAFTCTCPPGYTDVNGDGTDCSDIDECAGGAAACDPAATCTNVGGGFSCVCPAGYTDVNGDGTSCVDIDECATGVDTCDALVTCTNTLGSYTCGACPAGYDDVNGDGRTCADLDECAAGTDNCDVNATCSNTAGAFTCACNAPYFGSGTSCAIPTSCSNLQTLAPNAPSGVYRIAPAAGLPYDVYCDMTTEGGGWTLALKADGRQTTFDYFASLWTDSVLLNDASRDVTRTEAKLEPFVRMPYGRLLIRFESPIVAVGDPVLRSLQVQHTGTSLRATFSGGYVAPAAPIGRDAWKTLAGNGSLQANCNREGFNVQAGGISLRLGISSNQENDCGTNDSFVGVGGNGNPCSAVGGGNLAVGNIASCMPDNGDRKQAAFAWVYLHD